MCSEYPQDMMGNGVACSAYDILWIGYLTMAGLQVATDPILQSPVSVLIHCAVPLASIPEFTGLITVIKSGSHQAKR
jgi:hypothetical protein